MRIEKENERETRLVFQSEIRVLKSEIGGFRNSPRLLPFFGAQGIISAVYSFSRASTVMRPALWRAKRRRQDSSRAGRY
jgi:hypothetical protein